MPLSESAAHVQTVDDVVAAHIALRAQMPPVQAITNTVWRRPGVAAGAADQRGRLFIGRHRHSPAINPSA
jgi:hypothetical protein